MRWGMESLTSYRSFRYTSHLVLSIFWWRLCVSVGVVADFGDIDQTDSDF